MKRFLTIISALVVSLGAWAQGGQDVLRAMGEKVAEMGAYRIDFVLEMPGAESGSEGSCVVDGQRYLIEIEDMMQGCDGQTLWVASGANREITLGEPNTNSRSLFDNPTRAFDFAEELFEVVRFDDGDGRVWKLTLRPAKGVLDGIEIVTLEVSRATGLPTLLGYDMGGVGLNVKIGKFVKWAPKEDDFALPEMKGYEVIDFR